jgi:hypothetical protein
MRYVVLLPAFCLLLSWSLTGRGSLATSFATQDQDRQETTVRGELLKAFHSAYTAFLRNKAYPDNRKNIANYDVQFTETPENIIVFFSPRRKPGERPLLGGGTSLGMTLRVVVSKADYRVVEMKGYR